MICGKRKRDNCWGFFGDVCEGIEPCYEIAENEYNQLQEGQSNGKIIKFNEKTGKPYLEDPPEPTDDELITQIFTQRDRIFSETVDRLCNAARWDDMTEEQREKWRQFRRDLRDVDKQPGFPGKIEWPVSPE